MRHLEGVLEEREVDEEEDPARAVEPEEPVTWLHRRRPLDHRRLVPYLVGHLHDDNLQLGPNQHEYLKQRRVRLYTVRSIFKGSFNWLFVYFFGMAKWLFVAPTEREGICSKKTTMERESTLTTSGTKEIQISVPIPAHMTRGFKFAE